MDEVLRANKRAIRTFIREHWSDQRLAEVYAFNADDKMDWLIPCQCLIGVTLADVLHMRHNYCGGYHYVEGLSLSGATNAERAYINLHPRQRILSAILRAELRRRSREREALAAKLAAPVPNLDMADLDALEGALVSKGEA